MSARYSPTRARFAGSARNSAGPVKVRRTARTRWRSRRSGGLVGGRATNTAANLASRVARSVLEHHRSERRAAPGADRGGEVAVAWLQQAAVARGLVVGEHIRAENVAAGSDIVQHDAVARELEQHAH